MPTGCSVAWRGCSSLVAALVASNASLGALDTILTTPAEAFLPNSVFCGPRSTSMRSTSIMVLNAWPAWTWDTSSKTTSTAGSTWEPKV